MKRGCEVAFAKIKHFLKNNRHILHQETLRDGKVSVKLMLVSTSLEKQGKFQMAAGLPTTFEYLKSAKDKNISNYKPTKLMLILNKDFDAEF